MIYVLIYTLIAMGFGFYLPSHIYETDKKELVREHGQVGARDIAFYSGIIGGVLWPIVFIELVYRYIRKMFK